MVSPFTLSYRERMVWLISLILWLKLTEYSLVGPGAISYADPGVLEKVTERRIKNGWGLDRVNWSKYDLLGATAECKWLGKSGLLLSGLKRKTILIVDCEADVHKGQMQERGLLVDINNEDLVHKKGWLLLK